MKFFKIIMLLLLSVGFSCEKPYLVQCDDCLEEDPVNARVTVRLSDELNVSGIEILVYEGDLDDNIMYNISNTMVYDRMIITVPVNKKFTFVAVYSMSSGVYRAVDSATPGVRYDKEQCEEPCYFVYDNKVDLRLKYQ